MNESSLQADWSSIHYAQCWEDADVLLGGLDIQPGDRCLSIASGGDNSLAMLARDPQSVVAIDMNPTQLFCLELKVAAFRLLEHGETLELIGSRPSSRRIDLYDKARVALGDEAARFWDTRKKEINEGIGNAGKFEGFFRIFRRLVMPLIHSRRRIERLFEPRSLDDRKRFYVEVWNNRRWRWVFRLFFSRYVMGLLGREPSFFQYVEGSVSDRILERVEYGLTELQPNENPYLQWILLGGHHTRLPLYLREENYDKIRGNLDRLTWRLCSLEESCESSAENSIKRFNMSDVFEYISEESYHRLIEELARVSQPGGRLVYWNMLVPRSRPKSMRHRLRSLDALSHRLFLEDKAVFYSRLLVEEIVE